MVENLTRIKSGRRINVDVSAKMQTKIMDEKNLYLESCYM